MLNYYQSGQFSRGVPTYKNCLSKPNIDKISILTFLILIEVLNLNKSQFLNDRFQSEELIKQDKKRHVKNALANKQRRLEK